MGFGFFMKTFYRDFMMHNNYFFKIVIIKLDVIKYLFFKNKKKMSYNYLIEFNLTLCWCKEKTIEVFHCKKIWWILKFFKI